MSTKKLPQDYYFFAFSAEDEIGVPSVVLTSKEHFDKTGFWDDNLGSHNVGEEVKKALSNAGVYSGGELMEAHWEVLNEEATREEIIENMKREGFEYNEKMGME